MAPFFKKLAISKEKLFLIGCWASVVLGLEAQYAWNELPASTLFRSPYFYLVTTIGLGLLRRKFWSFQVVKWGLFLLAGLGLLAMLSFGVAGLWFYLDFETFGVLRDHRYMKKMFAFGFIIGWINFIQWIGFWVWSQLERFFPCSSRWINGCTNLYYSFQRRKSKSKFIKRRT